MPARELLAAPELEPLGTVKSIKFLQMQGQSWSVEFSNGSVKETVRMETSAEEMQEILSKSSI